MNVIFCVIDHTSPHYADVLKLRNEVLRRPLGLNLYHEDLSEDETQHIVTGILEDRVVACLMLKKLNALTVKLRQMAVEAALQGRGLGARLVQFAETFCLKQHYELIELNARKEAIGFYQKLGFGIVGGEFEEVGIAHFKMTKKLG